jgi:hypothetical protein
VHAVPKFPVPSILWLLEVVDSIHSQGSYTTFSSAQWLQQTTSSRTDSIAMYNALVRKNKLLYCDINESGTAPENKFMTMHDIIVF